MYVRPSSECEFDKYDEPRLHMERLLRTHLIEFDLSMRILCPLERAGIRTLGDLANSTREYVHGIYNIGQKGKDTLDSLLEYHMLQYKK